MNLHKREHVFFSGGHAKYKMVIEKVLFYFVKVKKHWSYPLVTLKINNKSMTNQDVSITKSFIK